MRLSKFAGFWSGLMIGVIILLLTGLAAFAYIAVTHANRPKPANNARHVSALMSDVSIDYLQLDIGLKIMVLVDSKNVGVFEVSKRLDAFSNTIVTNYMHASKMCANGFRVDYRATCDGKTIDLTINGELYNSSTGNLFLVTTKEGKIKVQQLNADLPEFSREAIQEFAKNNRDTAKMIAEAGAIK